MMKMEYQSTKRKYSQEPVKREKWLATSSSERLLHVKHVKESEQLIFPTTQCGR